MNTFFHSPNQLTEPEQWLGSATMMLYMFKGAAAFNQPLPETFDTSKVIDVRVSLRVRLDEKPVSDHFLPNFSSSSDAWHVLGCSGLRSTTTFGIRYFCGYGCECMFVLSPSWWYARFWLLIPTCFIIRCPTCSTVPRLSINHYLMHSILSMLNMWVHICVESNLMYARFWLPYSYPTCYQMGSMFNGAMAFNQPLPAAFDTAKVENVRVSLCWFWPDEKPVSDHFLPDLSSDGQNVYVCGGL